MNAEQISRQLEEQGIDVKEEVVKPPTMGNLKKISYTHQAMIDLIVAKPWLAQGELAAHFGYTPGWISNILASDAFQEQLAKRKEELEDPILKASIEERMKALTIQSISVLQKKLEQTEVSADVALKALELGSKGLGLGGNAPQAAPQPALVESRLRLLAGNLQQLRSQVYQQPSEGDVYAAEITVTETRAG